MLSLEVEIAVLTNVELDHHATFASLTELREAFARVPGAGERGGRRVGPAGAAGAAPRRAGRGRSLRRSRPARWPAARAFAGAATRCAWRCPARTTRSNAAAALEAARLAGARRCRGDRRAGRVPRRGPSLPVARAQPRGGARVRRLRAPPDGGRGDARCSAHARARTPDRGVPAASVLAHGAARARLRPRAGAGGRNGRARRLSGARARRAAPGRERPDDRRGRSRRGVRQAGLLAADASTRRRSCSTACSVRGTCAW